MQIQDTFVILFYLSIKTCIFITCELTSKFSFSVSALSLSFESENCSHMFEFTSTGFLKYLKKYSSNTIKKAFLCNQRHCYEMGLHIS